MKKRPDLLQWVGNPRGSFSKKENRAQRLLYNFDDLDEKLSAMVERGNGETKSARLALAALLMLYTGVRLGNESSAEGYVCNLKYHPDFGKTVKTYGLVTLQKKHFKDKQWGKLIDFVGKKNVRNQVEVTDPFLVYYLRQLLKGTDKRTDVVFTFNGRGSIYELSKFVKRYVGQRYSPKDLRLTFANQIFIERVQKVLFKKYTKISEVKKAIKGTIQSVANTLGNTLSVCRRDYVSKPLVEKCIEFQKEQLS